MYSNYRETSFNKTTVINKIHALRSMKLRSERNNTILLTPVLVFEILKYINPLLHHLVSRHYFFGAINNIDYDRKLPISLLLSLNNLEVLESFKTVLLSFNFRDNLAKQIAIYGDYSTMIWFQENDFTMSESALIDVAKRGDVGLFQKIINAFPGSCQILLREKSLLLFDSFTFAAENGH